MAAPYDDLVALNLELESATKRQDGERVFNGDLTTAAPAGTTVNYAAAPGYSAIVLLRNAPAHNVDITALYGASSLRIARLSKPGHLRHSEG